ncbi:MAG: hypothetical protein ABW069_09905 [Duganella sp.]
MKIKHLAGIMAGTMVFQLSAATPNAATAPDTHVPQAPMQPHEATGACEVLHWDRAGYDMPTLSITRPGKYCLDQDYEFACSPLAHSCRGELIHIQASDVDVDFRGHTLRVVGTRAFRGVWGMGRHIRIHHGRIVGAGSGVLLGDRGNSPVRAYPASPVSTTDVLTATGFVVEHMQFSDVRTAIMVAGSGNQIRDNRIDATLDNTAPGGPPFALLSYGPAARIERNTFRLSDLTPGWKGYAMYLRSADGTQVASNTVRVDGPRTGTVSVALSNSKDVELQSNQFETENITELDAGSGLR